MSVALLLEVTESQRLFLLSNVLTSALPATDNSKLLSLRLRPLLRIVILNKLLARPANNLSVTDASLYLRATNLFSIQHFYFSKIHIRPRGIMR